MQRGNGRKRTKRQNRIRREMHRHGGPLQGHGWAARQARKHAGRGRSTSQRKGRKADREKRG